MREIDTHAALRTDIETLRTDIERLCVPKTWSVLIQGRNRVT